MSEKRDLWVPAMLLLAGCGLLTWHVLAIRGTVEGDGSIALGVVAAILGLVAALASLALRMRSGQARLVSFGIGVMLILAAFRPDRPFTFLAVAPWIVAALAFLAPFRAVPMQTRVVLLVGAALAAVASAVLAILGVEAGWIWLSVAAAFFLAAQVWSSRVRPEKPPPPGPRICIYGGTFDPWHRGHRALCEAALRVNDRLLVVVAGSAPHKFLGEEGKVPERTPFHHRVSMTRLGVEGLPRTEVLELEGYRSGPSYTVDTLDVLFRSHPAGTRFRLLVGADMYLDFANWKDWESILERATLLVARRPGVELETPAALEGREDSSLGLEAPEIDVSGSEIRAAVAAGLDSLGSGRSFEEVLQPAIRTYIQDHGLFASVRDSE